jgi:hypothetical protein
LPGLPATLIQVAEADILQNLAGFLCLPFYAHLFAFLALD